MAPRSISPMDQEYTTNLTQIAQSQSQTLSPVKPSYNYNSLLSPIMAPRSPSSSAPSAVKLKQESIQQMNEIVDLTSISSDSELEFITTEIIDLTLQVKKRKKKKRKRNKKRNRKKHKKDAKKEVIEIIAISSESESDGLLEGDETRHKEVKPSLSASSTVQQIRKEVQKVCYNHIQFKDRVEFLVSMLQTILQCETSHEGHRANDDGNVSILIISPRRHSANYIYGLIKAFMTEISSSLCTGGIYSHYQADLFAGSISHTKAVIINWSSSICGVPGAAFMGYIQRATLSSGEIYNMQLLRMEEMDRNIIKELKKHKISMKEMHRNERHHGHRKRDRERWVYKQRRQRERDKRKERARERERSRHRGRRREGGSDYDSDMCEGYEGKHRRRRHTRY
eukprot:611411_1